MPHKDPILLKAKKRREHAAVVHMVRSVKLSAGCADCSYRTHHAGLEFDHRPGEIKRCNVATLVSAGGQGRIWDEILKCDVVCAACHNVRTWKRYHGLA